jgi:hypothetical protein
MRNAKPITFIIIATKLLLFPDTSFIRAVPTIVDTEKIDLLTRSREKILTYHTRVTFRWRCFFTKFILDLAQTIK